MKEKLVEFVNGKAGAIAAALHMPVFVVQMLLLLALIGADMAGYSTAGDLETTLAGTMMVGLLTGNVSWLAALLRKSVLDKPGLAAAVVEKVVEQTGPAVVTSAASAAFAAAQHEAAKAVFSKAS